jgi:hypothetical protein
MDTNAVDFAVALPLLALRFRCIGCEDDHAPTLTSVSRPQCPQARTARAHGDQVGKREALCACLNSRFLGKNIPIVSNFAQTAGAGSTFNQSSLAEERRQAGSPGPQLPQPAGPGSPCAIF